MDTYNLILHIVHISCGLFWGGAALMLHFFIMPAVQRSGPDGAKMMGTIMATRNLPAVLMVNAILTVVAGLMMMDYISGHFQGSWFGSNMGIILSIGGTTGIVAFLIGLLVNKPAASKIAKISAEMAQSGNPPTEAQTAELTANRAKIIMGIRIIAWLIIVTIVCMAGAHYV